MSVVLVCGSESSNLKYVQNLLEMSGIERAVSSKREGVSPHDFASNILTVNKVDPTTSRAIRRLKIGKAWEFIATDLLVSNLSSADWGWADTNLVYFLNYWKDFDPFINFVIVYSSPERILSKLIANGITDEAEIDQHYSIWKRNNAEYLKFYKANKTRCILVNIDKAEEDPKALIDMLNEREIAELEFTGAPEKAESAGGDTAFFDFVAASYVSGEDSLSGLHLDMERVADLSGGEEKSSDEIDRKHNMMPFMDPAETNGKSRQLAMSLLSQFQDMVQQKEDIFAQEIEDIKAERDSLGETNFRTLGQLHAALDELQGTFEQLEERNRQIEELKKSAVSADEVKRLQSGMSELEKKAKSLEQDKKKLSSEKDTLRKEKESLAKDNDKLKSLKDGLAAEIKGLNADNNAMTKQLGDLNKKLASINAEKDLLKAESAKAKDGIASISAKLAKAEAESSKAKELQGDLEEKAATSEQLLQQLHQVQSELEVYFKKYQELKDAKDAKPEPAKEPEKVASETPVKEVTKEKVPEPEVRNVEVDFCEFVDGENWYYAEADGRWAGPESSSTVNLKKPAPGTYTLSLEIVDAMAENIVKELKVFFEDKPVALAWPDKYATKTKRLRRTKKVPPLAYPLTLTGEVEVGTSGEDIESKVKLVMPETISPLTRGSTDRRELGIRVRRIGLNQV